MQLKVGNRIVSVNGESMTGKTGSDVCTRTLSSTTDYALQALKLRLDYRYNRAHTSHSVCLLCIWTYVCLCHLHVYLPTRTARIHIHIHIRIPCNNACARVPMYVKLSMTHPLFFLVQLENTDGVHRTPSKGVGAPHQCHLGVGSKLPLLLDADVHTF